MGKKCGAEGSLFQELAIPDEWPCPTSLEKAAFYKACQGHDDCYGMLGKTKEECDKAFRDRLRKECERAFNTVLEAPCRAQCYVAAEAYYQAVKQNGGDAYRMAQEEAKKKEAENEGHLIADQPISEGKMYFFRGDEYVRFDIGTDRADQAPQKIAKGWKGVWPEGVDAAVHWPGKSKVYLFRGDEYVRFNIDTDEADQAPQKIAKGWKGVWPEGVDATVLWPDKGVKGKMYFFRGDEYIRYDLDKDKADQAPQKIAKGWKGVWPEGVDAAIYRPSDRKIYFFRGDEYIRFDIDTDKADQAPQKIAKGWKGVWPEGVDAAVM